MYLSFVQYFLVVLLILIAYCLISICRVTQIPDYHQFENIVFNLNAIEIHLMQL